MTKTIGLVCEGPRDIEMISAVVDKLFPDTRFEYRYLQPDKSLQSENYNGWKGVLRWCRKNYRPICESREYLSPGIDLIIVQIDGDVSRDFKNKQSHCICHDMNCQERDRIKNEGMVLVEECSYTAEKCPLDYPCMDHLEEKPEAYVSHLNKILNTYLGDERPIPLLITIPCDSTDTWVVAAFEDTDMDYELLENPWSNVIARHKDYHGIRVPDRKKSKGPYKQLINKVTDNWEVVVSRCEQAARFQKEITLFGRNT